MARICKQISVDVAADNLFQPIVAKQNDSNSRFLTVTVQNEGTTLTIDKNSTIIINAQRDDGEAKAFAGAVNTDGTIAVPLVAWMLANEGTVRCDISIVDTEARKLTTMAFNIRVEAASYSDDIITDDGNYEILVDLIDSCTTLQTTLATTIADAVAATEAANIAAEAASGFVDGAQSDWTESDPVAADYIKNKPIVDTTVSEASTNAVASGAVYTAIQGLRSQTQTVTLTVEGWNTETKTISIAAPGVTADNTVLVAPAPISILAYAAAGVYCSAQGVDTLTFKCDTVPDVMLSVGVVILS